MSESPVLSLSVIAGTALRAGSCLEPFFFSLQHYLAKDVVQIARDWVIQHARPIFDIATRDFLSSRQIKQYIFRITTQRLLWRAVFLDGRFPTHLRYFWGLPTITKNAKDCKNEKTQLPTLFPWVWGCLGFLLSPLPSSATPPDLRDMCSLSSLCSCETLHLTTGHAGGVDLLAVHLC